MMHCNVCSLCSDAANLYGAAVHFLYYDRFIVDRVECESHVFQVRHSGILIFRDDAGVAYKSDCAGSIRNGILQSGRRCCFCGKMKMNRFGEDTLYGDAILCGMLLFVLTVF